MTYRARVVPLLAHVAMGIMFVAAVAKLCDLPSFAVALRTWQLLPATWTPWIALAVPLVEFGLSAAWFLGLSRRGALLGGLALLSGFTTFYAIEYRGGHPPDCACFGALERFRLAHAASKHLLLRNASLMLCLAVPLMAGMSPRETPLSGRRPADSRATGFTLIETLVAISMIALLVTLSAPFLREARTGARRAVSLSNLRMHTAVFAIYTIDFRDTWPCYTDRVNQWSTIRCESMDLTLEVQYFWASSKWHFAIADSYYDVRPTSPCFYSPLYLNGASSGEGRWGSTPYQYSCVFLADPAYWSPETRAGPSQWRATHVYEATFPSKKGLFTNAYFAPESSDPLEPGPRPTARTVWEMGLVDGAALGVLEGIPQFGYPYGDGPWTAPVHPGAGTPGSHTIDGVRGRDLP